tara:strand:- start:65 stop:322 length:258 start_codon:yes stop_codon:yes gene_type:complete
MNIINNMGCEVEKVMRVKKCSYGDGYNMIVGGIYIPFDKVVISKVDSVLLFNNDRFVCLVNYQNADEALKMACAEGIKVEHEGQE